jgi:hypothetical protein
MHARCATAQSRRGICASHSGHSPYKERPDCYSTYVQGVCMQSSHDNPRISKKSATYPHYISSFISSYFIVILTLGRKLPDKNLRLAAHLTKNHLRNLRLIPRPVRSYHP